jgi:hypothetical protein
VSDPISNIRRTGRGSQVAYDLTFACGHTLDGCGNGDAHLERDRKDAQGPCYRCRSAARHAAEQGDYRPLVASQPEDTRRLVASIHAGEEVAA